MGRMDIVISDELENEFRKIVAVKMGLKKGNVSIAVEEALREWLTKIETTKGRADFSFNRSAFISGNKKGKNKKNGLANN